MSAAKRRRVGAAGAGTAGVAPDDAAGDAAGGAADDAVAAATGTATGDAVDAAAGPPTVAATGAAGVAARPAASGASVDADTEPAGGRSGLVVAAHGRHVLVERPDGQRLRCHPRGKKSELVVGDRVRWAVAGDEGVVEAVEPRRNLLLRRDAWRTKAFAANLDQILVVVAGEPVFGESQLARALIAAADAGIDARIALNKVDLPVAAAARARLAPYVAMGVPVTELALTTDPDGARERLAALLHGRVTLVMGASGMGKSTLVNLMVPSAAAQVGVVSRALAAGRHTTTSSTWYWLDARRDGALIDSPGFQEFGLRQIAAERLALLMPDYAAASGQCRFHNCSHRHEPGCGVQAAAARGDISVARQRIYAALYDELSTRSG